MVKQKIRRQMKRISAVVGTAALVGATQVQAAVSTEVTSALTTAGDDVKTIYGTLIGVAAAIMAVAWAFSAVRSKGK